MLHHPGIATGHGRLIAVCCGVMLCYAVVINQIGDPEDEEAEVKLVWRGGDVVPSLGSPADQTAAPVTA